MLGTKQWHNNLNALINKGKFVIVLSPEDNERYNYLVSSLPVEYQPLIQGAFYVFQDEKMIQELYEAVPASVKSTNKTNKSFTE